MADLNLVVTDAATAQVFSLSKFFQAAGTAPGSFREDVVSTEQGAADQFFWPVLYDLNWHSWALAPEDVRGGLCALQEWSRATARTVH